MAAHSSVLAWIIPWTEEPGGLQSTESVTAERAHARAHTHTHTHVPFNVKDLSIHEFW